MRKLFRSVRRGVALGGLPSGSHGPGREQGRAPKAEPAQTRTEQDRPGEDDVKQGARRGRREVKEGAKTAGREVKHAAKRPKPARRKAGTRSSTRRRILAQRQEFLLAALE
jgi:hypothetical protein